MPTNNSQSIPDLAHSFIESIQSGDNHFFAYGSTIVEPIADPDTGEGQLKALSIKDLKWYLRRVFSGESENIIAAVAEDILHDPELSLQRIRGLVTTPTFRDDFSLITAPGYDQQSGLYYSPDPSLRDCTFRTGATVTEGKESLDHLLELLTDFPFVDKRERFNYLATLFTLFLRSAIPSVVPCLAIDGNGQNVGKSLLSTMLNLILYGQDMSTISAPTSREEWASTLDSILLKGKPFQVVDNVVANFASADFASILTSRRRNVRIKGLSKVVDVPVNTLWLLNGNHLNFDSDLSQRTIMCHLEHPEADSRKQENFKIQKKYGCSIETLLGRERALYTQHCLNVVCAWVNAGAPKRQKLVLAKYGVWESIIGGIMDAIAPESKFLADHRNKSSALDAEKEENTGFLRQIIAVFPNCDKTPIDASQIADKVFPKFSESFSSEKSSLRDFVPDTLAGSKGSSSFAKRLGKWLQRISTRRWGTIELVPVEDKHRGVWTYCIGDNIKRKAEKEGLGELFEEECDESEAA